MATNLNIKVIDRGWKKAQKNINRLVKLEGIAGLLKDAGTENVGIGAIQELGSKKSNIPRRSFIKTTIFNNRGKYKTDITKFVNELVEGKGDPAQSIDAFMNDVSFDMKRTVEEKKSPPNKPSTIKRKKFNNPLVETRTKILGNLKGTVRSRTP